MPVRLLGPELRSVKLPNGLEFKLIAAASEVAAEQRSQGDEESAAQLEETIARTLEPGFFSLYGTAESSRQASTLRNIVTHSHLPRTADVFARYEASISKALEAIGGRFRRELNDGSYIWDLVIETERDDDTVSIGVEVCAGSGFQYPRVLEAMLDGLTDEVGRALLVVNDTEESPGLVLAKRALEILAESGTPEKAEAARMIRIVGWRQQDDVDLLLNAVRELEQAG